MAAAAAAGMPAAAVAGNPCDDVEAPKGLPNARAEADEATASVVRRSPVTCMMKDTWGRTFLVSE